MKDVNHTIAILRDLTGLPVLELNGNGHLELIFDDKISIDLIKIDDSHIELSAPLDIADLNNPERLQTLLTANYHGSGTGFARIAIDRRDKSALICERIDVTPLDPGRVRGAAPRLCQICCFLALRRGRRTDAVAGPWPCSGPRSEPHGHSQLTGLRDADHHWRSCARFGSPFHRAKNTGIQDRAWQPHPGPAHRISLARSMRSSAGSPSGARRKSLQSRCGNRRHRPAWRPSVSWGRRSQSGPTLTTAQMADEIAQPLMRRKPEPPDPVPPPKADPAPVPDAVAEPSLLDKAVAYVNGLLEEPPKLFVPPADAIPDTVAEPSLFDRFYTILGGPKEEPPIPERRRPLLHCASTGRKTGGIHCGTPDLPRVGRKPQPPPTPAPSLEHLAPAIIKNWQIPKAETPAEKPAPPSKRRPSRPSIRTHSNTPSRTRTAPRRRRILSKPRSWWQEATRAVKASEVAAIKAGIGRDRRGESG